MSAYASRDDAPNEPDADYGESSAKLWSIYVNATKKYDRALVESWKGDMDGILIFAGLFSASVTAFLIESTKLLQTGSSATSTDILAQMSLQLAALSNSSLPPVPAYQRVSDAPVPNYALRVNILWFLSLLLSLLCALGATLIQGWARNYLHAIEYHAAPHQRARIRAFLFHGIEQSRMKTIVDGVPALLHASLFLFIAGMQQNLAAINHTIALLILIMLVIYAGIYVVTSILPIIKLNCPYQTPLSSILWQAKQLLLPLHFRDFRLQKTSISSGGNLARGRSEFAMNSAMQSRYHDVRALSWTLSAITEDSTLAAFIDGIPGYLHSTQVLDPTSTMLELITKSKLGFYISQILESCDSKYSLSRELQIQRGSSCLHAVSALVARLNQYIPEEKWTSCFPPSAAASILGLTYKRPRSSGIYLQACCTSVLMHWTLLDEYEQMVIYGRHKLLNLVGLVSHIDELPVTSTADDYPYVPSHAMTIQRAKEDVKIKIKNVLNALRNDPFISWQAAMFDTMKLLNQKAQLYKDVNTNSRIQATLDSQCAETKSGYLYFTEENLMMQEIDNANISVLRSIFEYLALQSQALHHILSMNTEDPLSDHDIKKIKDCLSHWCSPSAPNEIWEMITAAQVSNFIQLSCIVLHDLMYLTEADTTVIMETLHSIRVSHLRGELTEKMQLYLVLLLKSVKDKHLTSIEDWEESSLELSPYHINILVQVAESIILFTAHKVISRQLLADIKQILLEWQKKSPNMFKIIQGVIPAISEKLGSRFLSLDHSSSDHLIQNSSITLNSSQSSQSYSGQMSISIPARNYREPYEDNSSSFIRRRHPYNEQHSAHSYSPYSAVESFESGLRRQGSTSIMTYGFPVPNSALEIGQFEVDEPQAPRAEIHELPDTPQIQTQWRDHAASSSVEPFLSLRSQQPLNNISPVIAGRPNVPPSRNDSASPRELLVENHSEPSSEPGSPLALLQTPNSENSINLPRILVDAGTPQLGRSTF